jgi:hypothetical protein
MNDGDTPAQVGREEIQQLTDESHVTERHLPYMVDNYDLAQDETQYAEIHEVLDDSRFVHDPDQQS